MKIGIIPLLALVFFLMPMGAHADTLSVPCLYQQDKGCNPVGGFPPAPAMPVGTHVQISGTTLASATSLTVPLGALGATINNSGTGPVNFTYDGVTAPTSSLGEVLAAGATLTVTNSPAVLATLQFIIGSTSGGQLDVDFSK